jgi:transposase InsO family protein
MMRYSPAEKMEIIHMVEHSNLSIRQTLAELDLPRSTFYDWYRKYQEEGVEGLTDKKPGPRQFWNRIPEVVREQVVDLALEHPDKSPRQLAWRFTDREGNFISESSVYRILKGFDLVASPAFLMVPASDQFEHPSTRVNELWQTDFTHFKVQGWGWYYLSTVLDDYSRYILAWKLTTTMGSEDVKETLEMALEKTGLQQVKVKHRPRLLSDNGPCYISSALKDYLQQNQIEHVRGAPYHPMTQGKIERYHRSMKNVVLLCNYFYPWELEQSIAAFVEYYNHQRYHESLQNLTPEDVYLGREKEVLSKRDQIKQQTLAERRAHHFNIIQMYNAQ